MKQTCNDQKTKRDNRFDATTAKYGKRRSARMKMRQAVAEFGDMLQSSSWARTRVSLPSSSGHLPAGYYLSSFGYLSDSGVFHAG